jgi:hypothetical protein
MRVALDVSIQGRGEATGVERAQATLIAALARRAGLELLLCAPRALEGELARELAGCGRALAVAADAPRLPLALWRETVLPRALAGARAELLHSPVAAVPLRAGCPTIATLHELPWVEHARHGDARWTHRARVALAARLCRRITGCEARKARTTGPTGRAAERVR